MGFVVWARLSWVTFVEFRGSTALTSSWTTQLCDVSHMGTGGVKYGVPARSLQAPMLRVLPKALEACREISAVSLLAARQLSLLAARQQAVNKRCA